MGSGNTVRPQSSERNARPKGTIPTEVWSYSPDSLQRFEDELFIKTGLPVETQEGIRQSGGGKAFGLAVAKLLAESSVGITLKVPDLSLVKPVEMTGWRLRYSAPETDWLSPLAGVKTETQSHFWQKLVENVKYWMTLDFIPASSGNSSYARISSGFDEEDPSASHKYVTCCAMPDVVVFEAGELKSKSFDKFRTSFLSDDFFRKDELFHFVGEKLPEVANKIALSFPFQVEIVVTSNGEFHLVQLRPAPWQIFNGSFPANNETKFTFANKCYSGLVSGAVPLCEGEVFSWGGFEYEMNHATPHDFEGKILIVSQSELNNVVKLFNERSSFIKPGAIISTATIANTKHAHVANGDPTSYIESELARFNYELPDVECIALSQEDFFKTQHARRMQVKSNGILAELAWE